MPVNYELVYKIGPSLERMSGAASAVRAAEQKQADAIAKFRQSCATLSGVPLGELEFTNEACVANGIGSHVYAGRGMRGLGRRKCIFCGCDDFDGL